MSIAIIPARGGSKRIPRKNIKDFLGKPIIAYSIDAAWRSGVFDTVVVSTDDEEIADIAKRYGAEVPFLRNAQLSNDMTMIRPVLVNALDELEKLGRHYPLLCCIFPCAPLVTPSRLREGIELLASSNADTVFPVAKFSYPPQRCLVVRNGRAEMLWPENYNARSQDLEPLYHDAGQFYCHRVEALRRDPPGFGVNALPIILPDSEVQDIDTLDDWQLAELKYRMLFETADRGAV